MLFFGITAIIFGLICFKFGDWRNWKLYYPTMLYFIVGAFGQNLLTYKNPLWLFKVLPFGDEAADFVVSFLLFPSVIILYLSNYPKTIIKQIIYNIVSALIFSLLEVAAYFTGTIIYFHGWNCMWSALFYLIMFPLLRLHFKSPLWVWPISVALAIVFLYYFKLPFAIDN